MARIINLFAGPGAGKSTTAAGLFFKLKTLEYKVELVTEFAKDLVYENRKDTLINQPYIFGKQYNRLMRVKDKVDFIITDSPLLLSYVYAMGAFPDSFLLSVYELSKQMNNMNFFIERTKKYQPYGRSQSEVEAHELDIKIKKMLNDLGVPFTTVIGDEKAAEHIASWLPNDTEIIVG